MSGSEHRPPGKARPRRRSGPDRRVTHGFSRLPEPARPVVVEVLDEMGIGALVDLCAGLRLELSEVCRMERDGAGRWVLNDEFVPLPEETSSRLGAWVRTSPCRGRERLVEKRLVTSASMGAQCSRTAWRSARIGP